MCKLKSYLLVFLCFLGTINGRLCAAPRIEIKPTADALCTANPFISFMIDFEDDGSFGTGNRYIFEFSVDGIDWNSFYSTGSVNWGYTQRPTNLQEGWYRVSAARLGEEEQPDKWSIRLVEERFPDGIVSRGENYACILTPVLTEQDLSRDLTDDLFETYGIGREDLDHVRIMESEEMMRFILLRSRSAMSWISLSPLMWRMCWSPDMILPVLKCVS